LSFAKIALRNIPRRKLRNSLTVLGIVIGVALLVGVNIAAESSFVEFKSYIEAVGGKIDIVVTTVSGSAFEQRKVDSSVAGLGYVQSAGRLGEGGLIRREGQARAVSVTGVDPVRDFEYRGYTFEGSGTLRRNDATISQRMSEDLGIKIGDYITRTWNFRCLSQGLAERRDTREHMSFLIWSVSLTGLIIDQTNLVVGNSREQQLPGLYRSGRHWFSLMSRRAT